LFVLIFIEYLGTCNSEHFCHVCFQDVVTILENIMEQSKNTSLHQVQPSSITEQEQKEEIFKMAFAFEDFARKYAQYHLNESVPQLNIANNKLGKWKYFNLNHSNLGKGCNNIIS